MGVESRDRKSRVTRQRGKANIKHVNGTRSGGLSKLFKFAWLPIVK